MGTNIALRPLVCLTAICCGAGSLAIICSATAARAEVKPHPLFSENAVLQQDMDVPVWGTADNGEVVTVEIQGQKVSGLATGGKWKVVLEPLSPRGPFTLKIEGNKGSVLELKNVLAGEVWIVSGQSNMAMGLGDTENAEQVKARSEDSLLRFCHVPQTSSHEIKREVDVKWAECNACQAHMFSAVGYYFGCDLRKARGVPVGLIQSVVGGSFAHVWMPRPYLEADPELHPLLDWYPQILKTYEQSLAEYRRRELELRQKYLEELAKAKAAGLPAPQPPTPPANPEDDGRMRTNGLYHAMIAPLQPYAIRGVCWYQGENDVGLAWRYRTVLPMLIRSWRETWGEGDFPFLIVQLPAYYKIVEEPTDSEWAELREAQ